MFIVVDTVLHLKIKINFIFEFSKGYIMDKKMLLGWVCFKQSYTIFEGGQPNPAQELKKSQRAMDLKLALKGP